MTSATALALAPSASAEVIQLAPHQKSITTSDGWNVTLRADNETWNKVPPLNMAGTSREGFGTFAGTAQVSGQGSSALKAVSLEVGYQVSCFADLASVGMSFQATVQPQIGVQLYPVGPIPTAQLGAVIGPSFSVNMTPGTIVEIPVARKDLEAGIAVLQIREAHISVNGCIGPSQVRSYAKVVVDSKLVKDGTAVYGDSFPI